MARIRSLAGVVVGLALSCGEPRDAETDPVVGSEEGTCQVGSEACACTGGGGCDPGLTCLSGVCVDAGGTSMGDGADDGATDGGEGSGTTSAVDDTAGDDGPKLDVGPAPDVPVDVCEQDVDVVFTMDVSTTMTFFFDALLADMADVDAALAAVNANPRYGLIVFVDDYAVVNAGQPFDDIAALQAEFMNWKVFTTSIFEPQIGGGFNSTYPENSLDALYHAAQTFQWRPAESTLRLVIHATDDTFSEAPTQQDGIAVQHTYDETIAALQGAEVRVAAFAAHVGGPVSAPTDVSAGWFAPWTGGQDSIPDSTGGLAFDIDGILDGTQSLGDAIVQTVEEIECTPYPEG